MNTKKILVPTIIAIVTLSVLVVGATYAYFTVGTTNSFSTRKVEASTAELGTVTLTSGNNLTMTLSAADMMQSDSDVTYYASTSGKTNTDTSVPIATATVTGGDNHVYICNYTLTITDNDNSLYDAFQAMSTKSTGQIVLTVGGSNYDFTTPNLFPKTINGTIVSITKSAPQSIKAKLKIVNKKDVDQSALAGKNITLSFAISSFDCTVAGGGS